MCMGYQRRGVHILANLQQTAAMNAATTLGFVGGPAIGGLLFLLPGTLL